MKRFLWVLSLIVGCAYQEPPWTAEEVDLGIKMQQQEASQWCWAALAQAVAYWHGELFTQTEIVTLSFGRACSPESCNGAYRPNKLFALIGVKELGLAPAGITLDDLWRSQLEKRRPIKVILTNGSSNHMVLIGGYNLDGFYLYDPSDLGKGEKQIVTIEDLNSNYGYHIDTYSFIAG